MNISINDLSKSYGQHSVLSHLNASFEEGRIHVLLGPSGIGKTTLLRILMGLEKADSGKVTGMEGRKKSAVFQEDRLIETLGAGANIAVVMKQPKRQASLKAEELLEKAGMNGLYQQAAGSLSGGQKRRVSILRALSIDADVYFFDEALRELDQESTSSICRLIHEKTAGRTVFWVSHVQDYEFFDQPVIWHLEKENLLKDKH